MMTMCWPDEEKFLISVQEKQGPTMDLFLY